MWIKVTNPVSCIYLFFSSQAVRLSFISLEQRLLSWNALDPDGHFRIDCMGLFYFCCPENSTKRHVRVDQRCAVQWGRLADLSADLTNACHGQNSPACAQSLYMRAVVVRILDMQAVGFLSLMPSSLSCKDQRPVSGTGPLVSARLH